MEPSLLFWCFFRVLSVRRVFGEELWIRGWGMCLEIFPSKMPPFSPKNPAIKSSPFLSPSFQSSTFLRVCVRGVLGSELCFCSGAISWSCFCWLGALFLLYRGETDAGFLGGGGFGVFVRVPPFSSSLLFLLLLPPFCSRGRLGFSFSSSWRVSPGHRPLEEGRALHHALLSFFSFLLSLPGPASPSLSLVLSLLSLSLSLFLFLSCMHLI